MTLKDSKKSLNGTCRNGFNNSWLKHKYAIYLYVLRGNAYMRPGWRRQRLILVTKAIIQLILKKKKKTAALTCNPCMKCPLLSRGGCCGATVRALVSSARGPGFESHRGQEFLGLQA